MRHEGDTTLFTVAEVRAGLADEILAAEYVAALRVVCGWVDDYLCSDHPALGRPGPVCPYVGSSVRRDLLRLAVVPVDNALAAEDTVTRFMQVFMSMPPAQGAGMLLKTILIIFPNLEHDSVKSLDDIQRKLKPEYVGRGLMIGQFYEGCQLPGIWNENFRPLQSPIPLLAIRHMVASDFPFLIEQPAFLDAYFQSFATDIPEHIRRLLVGQLMFARHDRGE